MRQSARSIAEQGVLESTSTSSHGVLLRVWRRRPAAREEGRGAPAGSNSISAAGPVVGARPVRVGPIPTARASRSRRANRFAVVSTGDQPERPSERAVAPGAYTTLLAVELVDLDAVRTAARTDRE